MKNVSSWVDKQVYTDELGRSRLMVFEYQADEEGIFSVERLEDEAYYPRKKSNRPY